jgi:hypothetical protein
MLIKIKWHFKKEVLGTLLPFLLFTFSFLERMRSMCYVAGEIWGMSNFNGEARLKDSL